MAAIEARQIRRRYAICRFLNVQRLRRVLSAEGSHASRAFTSGWLVRHTHHLVRPSGCRSAVVGPPAWSEDARGTDVACRSSVGRRVWRDSPRSVSTAPHEPRSGGEHGPARPWFADRSAHAVRRSAVCVHPNDRRRSGWIWPIAKDCRLCPAVTRLGRSFRQYSRRLWPDLCAASRAGRNRRKKELWTDDGRPRPRRAYRRRGKPIPRRITDRPESTVAGLAHGEAVHYSGMNPWLWSRIAWTVSGRDSSFHRRAYRLRADGRSSGDQSVRCHAPRPSSLAAGFSLDGDSSLAKLLACRRGERHLPANQ